jgi:hypothetical protein
MALDLKYVEKFSGILSDMYTVLVRVLGSCSTYLLSVSVVNHAFKIDE